MQVHVDQSIDDALSTALDSGLKLQVSVLLGKVIDDRAYIYVAIPSPEPEGKH